MLPRKTEQARNALQAHRAPLDMRQRRLLILCDGQRDLAALTALIGPQTPAMVIQLVQAGYLLTTPEATPPATQPAAAADPDARAPINIPPPSHERRRSLAAARIYLLGILEMQRHPEAAALLRALQQSRRDDDVVLAMQSALHALPTLTSVGYAERVRERLLEVMPTEHGNPFAAVAA